MLLARGERTEAISLLQSTRSTLMRTSPLGGALVFNDPHDLAECLRLLGAANLAAADRAAAADMFSQAEKVRGRLLSRSPPLSRRPRVFSGRNGPRAPHVHTFVSCPSPPACFLRVGTLLLPHFVGFLPPPSLPLSLSALSQTTPPSPPLSVWWHRVPLSVRPLSDNPTS